MTSPETKDKVQDRRMTIKEMELKNEELSVTLDHKVLNLLNKFFDIVENRTTKKVLPTLKFDFSKLETTLQKKKNQEKEGVLNTPDFLLLTFKELREEYPDKWRFYIYNAIYKIEHE
jgi:hypothetical protein